MKKYDKWSSHISSKPHMIYISSRNNRDPVTKTFTPLHYTCRLFTSSHLNFIQLHFTTLSFALTPFKFPAAPFHLTSLHFTSFHFTALLDDFRQLFLRPQLVPHKEQTFSLITNNKHSIRVSSCKVSHFRLILIKIGSAEKFY